MANGINLGALIQAAQLGRSLNPEVMQQQALGNQLAQQLQQLQIAKLIRDQEDWNNPAAANMRALQTQLSGEVRNRLSPTVRLSPEEALITTPIALPGAITQAQEAALSTPAIDEMGFPVLNQPIPRAAALGESVVPILSDFGQPTGFADDLNKLIAGAGRQQRIENIINPPAAYNLPKDTVRYQRNPQTGIDEIVASNLSKEVTPKNDILSKGQRLVSATGQILAENPSDTPKPTIVPSGGVILNEDGTVKFRNDKPDASASSEQYQFERIDRIKDSIDRIKQNVRSGTTGRSASLQSGTLFPKFAQTRGYVKLREDLESLKANIFTKELQAMRASSKTGGAIGNVSNLEGTRLSNALVALNQELDAPDLIANLDIAYDSIEKYRKELEKQGGSPTANQTVEMTAPDGRLLQVPADKVDEAISRGAKRVR